MGAIVQADIKVYGVVQGVFFRASAQAEAARLGVCGWVRNCPDGSVEASAQGPSEAVRKFKDWCSRGPAGAFVERAECEYVDPHTIYDRFSITF